MSVPSDNLPPDAAARDAARRAAIDADDVLSDTLFRFVTRNVSPDEKAAVIAALTEARYEDTVRVKRVERIQHEPWRRAQRLPRTVGDLLENATPTPRQ